MSCCTVEGTGRFFSKGAGSCAKRFGRKGLDKTQRIIARSLNEAGAGGSLLEIGCGVGGLHLTLLGNGAESAIGVDISEGMIGRAREFAARMGLTERTVYHVGDFTSLAGSIPHSDVVILDKVVCCYTDFEGLIRTSAGHARKYYVLSYPREAVLARTAFWISGAIGRLFRRGFAPIYHVPALIESAVAGSGFREVSSGSTPVWQVRVYTRAA